MEVDYKQKYLKYKEKYLKLKAQLGGDYGRLYCTFVDKKDPNNHKTCTCIEYKGAYDYTTVKEIRSNGKLELTKPLLSICVNCDHAYEHHVRLEEKLTKYYDRSDYIEHNKQKDILSKELEELNEQFKTLRSNRPNRETHRDDFTKYLESLQQLKSKIEIKQRELDTHNNIDINAYKTILNSIKHDPSGTDKEYILKDYQILDEKKKLKLSLIRELQQKKEEYYNLEEQKNNPSTDKEKFKIKIGNINSRISEINRQLEQIDQVVNPYLNPPINIENPVNPVNVVELSELTQ